MAFNVTADPGKFKEALDWFKKRYPSIDIGTLRKWAADRAFIIAGVAELDVVTQVHNEIQRAIDDGTGFDDFKKSVTDSLESAWQNNDATPTNVGWRVETIFRTNIQKSYNAGRWQQIHDPDVLEYRPYLMFDAILDSRTTDICQERNGTILPADDDFWNSNNPPLHFNCRSSLRSLSQAEGDRRGVSDSAPDVEDAADGFGSAPDDDAWEPSAADYPRELWNIYREKTG